MGRIRNIAKTIILLTAILLVGGTRYAYAQNSGTEPYRGSKHAYQVKVGKHLVPKRWILTNKQATPTSYDLKSVSWATYTPATADGGNDNISIWFKQTEFTANGIWYLQYFEDMVQADGTTICTAAREQRINLIDNSFYLTLANDDDICNSLSVDTIDYTLVQPQATPITYTVTMHKGTDFNINQWEFDALFSQNYTTLGSATVTTTGGGTATISAVAANSAHIVVTPPLAGSPDEVEIAFEVSFLNPVFTPITPEVEIQNGLARSGSGPNPWVYTDDNTLLPTSPGDRKQAITILDIPETQNIDPGVGITATAATYPLQESTHKYAVTMEDFANTRTWSIINTIGTKMTDPTDYTLTDSHVGNIVTATISFTDVMPVGTYNIYFTEENVTTGCSTVRKFTIHLNEPLDVSIALTNPGDDAIRCAGISGTCVINPDVDNATTTIITYTVKLNTELNSVAYGFDWSFDLAVTTNKTFVATDVDVESGDIAVTGGTFTAGGDNYSGSVAIAGGVTEVTIAVTYTGFYVNEHELTLSLTNIIGSFNDVAADVSVKNTIQPMPQPVTLLGVD